eukprot:scaffold609753_cov19-Prasinocladus_malaysianus.AAC.1
MAFRAERHPHCVLKSAGSRSIVSGIPIYHAASYWRPASWMFVAASNICGSTFSARQTGPLICCTSVLFCSMTTDTADTNTDTSPDMLISVSSQSSACHDEPLAWVRMEVSQICRHASRVLNEMNRQSLGEDWPKVYGNWQVASISPSRALVARISEVFVHRARPLPPQIIGMRTVGRSWEGRELSKSYRCLGDSSDHVKTRQGGRAHAVSSQASHFGLYSHGRVNEGLQ